jgi:menaquinone-specific isochorismate synthase
MIGQAGLARRGALVARTVELRTEVDLARVAGQEGVLWEKAGTGFAGRGIAATVTVAPGRMAAVAAEVGELLSSIETDGTSLPVAIGALPFSSSIEGRLIVPEVLVRREGDGTTTLTVTRADPDVDSAARVARWATQSPHPKSTRPTEYVVRSVTGVRRWSEQVAGAAKAVAAGRLGKVVLAREVAVMADRTIPVADVARRLGTAYPSCMVFAADGFVGASPELLVARAGERVWSQPLAGTAPREGTPGADNDAESLLLSSAKEREEHRLVVEAVRTTLARFCDELEVPRVPSLVPAGVVAHLGTAIEGRLADPLPSALELAAALHPTPAVAGTPTEAALAYIAMVEGADRGRYAGPVGWMDAAGDGEWAVAIRSAQLAGSTARLLAGAGIVAESVAEAELVETELKFQPMLNAIVRP